MTDTFKLGQLMALQAEVFAVNAAIAGMVAENTSCEQAGVNIQYVEESFTEKAEELSALSNHIRGVTYD